MTLPTEKSKKKTSPFEYTILLYGEPKIGKSTACSRIPDALFIQTEAGLKNLNVYKTPLVETWDEFQKICAEIAEGKHNFKTIIIDTIDGLYQLCARHISKQHGWADKLSALPTGLVLVGHSKEKEVRTRTGTFDRVTLCFSNSIEEAITAFVDVALFCHVEGVDEDKKRIVRSVCSNEYFAGGRINFFEDGMLLEDLFTKQIKGGK
jgi:hypothetical protein